ncbi:MAG: hypothetical protein ACI4UK_11395 [Floccifex sp.]
MIKDFDYEVETDLLEESLLNVCELKGIAKVLGNEMFTYTDSEKSNYQDILYMASQSIRRISNELDEKLEKILYMRAK